MEDVALASSNDTNTNYAYMIGVFYAITNLQLACTNLIPFALFVLRVFFGVHTYFFSDRETMNIINRKITDDWCKDFDNEGRPSGLVIHRQAKSGPWARLIPFDVPCYVVYKQEFERYLYVYTTPQYMRDVLLQTDNRARKTNLDTTPADESNDDKDTALKDDPNVEDSTQSEAQKGGGRAVPFKYAFRTGDAMHIRYRARSIHFPKCAFNANQAQLYRRTMEFYNEHNYATVFIDGVIGSGKTTFAYYLSSELGAILVDSFNPTEPSDSFSNMYMSLEHSPTKPLVVLMDEIDVMLRDVTCGITAHKNHLISVRNKTQWNVFLDRIQFGCFPNVILVLVSNRSREFIGAEMDPSYLRDGRVNVSATF